MHPVLLENELCARLLAQAQVLRRELAVRAWEANLTLTDFLALRQMVRSIYAFSPGEIARVLGCSRSNGTKVMQRLEAVGYISISVNAFEPKTKSIRITQAGRDAYARAQQRHEHFGRFARLSEDERKELYRLLGLVGPPTREAPQVG